MLKLQVISIAKGATAGDRRIINSAIAAGAAPTLNTDGHFINRPEYIHLFFKLINNDSANSCTFYVRLWWWSPITETWHIGENLKVNGNDLHTIESQGLTRLYLQVENVVFTGSGTPTLDAWVGSVIPI